MPKGAEEATGVDGCRLAVRNQLAAGADWIKIYADYHRGEGRPATATFTVEEIAAMVHEATTAGIPVAAHATTVEGIERSIQRRASARSSTARPRRRSSSRR